MKKRKQVRRTEVLWEQMISEYLLFRENLSDRFVIIDSRLDPQKIDLEFINWFSENQIPFALIFTKADKQSINKGQQNIAKFKRALKATWEVLSYLPHLL